MGGMNGSIAMNKFYENKVYDLALAVTASDTGNLTDGLPYTAFVAGAAGLVTVDVLNGATNIAIPVAAGVVMPLSITRVYETGTTATPTIVALKHDLSKPR